MNILYKHWKDYMSQPHLFQIKTDPRVSNCIIIGLNPNPVRNSLNVTPQTRALAPNPFIQGQKSQLLCAPYINLS